MQARNLSIGEVPLSSASSSSSSQVVKVLLDVPSQSFAFLLADSSCLLFSSPVSGKSSPSPFIIPPLCSDFCFLRLRERNNSKSNTISSSSSSGKSSARSESRNVPNAVKTRNFEEEKKVFEERKLLNDSKIRKFEEEKKPSEQRRHLEQEKKKVCEERKLFDEKKKAWEERRNPFEEHTKLFEQNNKLFHERKPFDEEKKKKHSDSMDGCGSMSNGRNTDLDTDELVFLVAKPAKGGSGTDVVGWKCSEFQFVQISVSLEDDLKGRKCCSKSNLFSAARFLDIPHGSFIGLSASVNVMVLYSPTLARVWILSAKLGGGREHDLSRTSKSVAQDIDLEQRAKSGGHNHDLGQNVQFGGQDHDFGGNDAYSQGQNDYRNAKHGDLIAEVSENLLAQGQDHGSNGELVNLTAGYGRKLLDHDEDNIGNAKTGYFSAANSVKNLHRTKQENMNGKQENWCLHLVKCAIVDCNGPIYDLHVSLQYLLIGQLGGVRVWPLRPLIKGHITSKKKKISKVCANGQNKEHYNKFETAHKERSKILEIHDFGNKKFEISSEFLERDSTLVEDIGFQKTLKRQELTSIKPKNGFHGVDVLENEFMVLNLKTITSFPDKSNCSERKIKGQKCNCNDNASVPVNANLDLETIQTGQNGVTLADASSKLSYSQKGGEQGEFDQEEPNSQPRTSQSSVFSSSSNASSSAPVFCSTTHRAVAQSSSCHSSSSSISSNVETACTVQKDEFTKRVQEGLFVPFHNQIIPMKTSEQVVSICSLSGKEYLILDSQGKLYLLVLQYSHRGGERMMLQQQISQAPLNAFMQPLPCVMKIKMVAATSVASTSENSLTSASKALWVSDGSHTIHVILLPTRETSKGVSEDNILQLRSNPTVIQTVFTADRICSLSALSVNAVLVQTEGSMIVYFLSGS